jgi:hypothetical protein
MRKNEVFIKSSSALNNSNDKLKSYKQQISIKPKTKGKTDFSLKKREEEQTSDDEVERLFDKMASTDDLVS